MWSVALLILSTPLRYSVDLRPWRHLMEACVQPRQARQLWCHLCRPTTTTGWEITLLFTITFSLANDTPPHLFLSTVSIILLQSLSLLIIKKKITKCHCTLSLLRFVCPSLPVSLSACILSLFSLFLSLCLCCCLSFHVFVAFILPLSVSVSLLSLLNGPLLTFLASLCGLVVMFDLCMFHYDFSKCYLATT